MPKKVFPIHPAHPERVCWGCDKYCPSNSMACGNGSERTQHPVELFGDDWAQLGLDPFEPQPAVEAGTQQAPSPAAWGTPASALAAGPG